MFAFGHVAKYNSMVFCVQNTSKSITHSASRTFVYTNTHRLDRKKMLAQASVHVNTFTQRETKAVSRQSNDICAFKGDLLLLLDSSCWCCWQKHEIKIWNEKKKEVEFNAHATRNNQTGAFCDPIPFPFFHCFMFFGFRVHSVTIFKINLLFYCVFVY